MKFANFVHLHTHSQYSLLDGACKIDPLIQLAKDMKMPALAVTDHGNMFGAAEFYKKATKAGIKPIIGTEAYVAATSRLDKRQIGNFPAGGFHLVLLAKNNAGYQNLIKLSSAGYQEGFYHRPRIDKELLREYSEGLIALTACLKGEVNWHLMHNDPDSAIDSARELHEIFGEGNFFLEMQNHGLEKEEMIISMIETIHKETKIPLVATNDCHYLYQKDAEAHDALICIQTGKFVSDTDRMKYNTDQIYFKSAEEMTETFLDYPEAIRNTIRIAEECNVEIEMDKNHLPGFEIPTSFKNNNAYLRHLTDEGAKIRYETVTDEIRERMDYELSIIEKMNYAGYFLIVRDFIEHARSIDVPVGPGRGSAAGSLVSYCVGITNIDPMKYQLLFERFLNPERISMPDIDIDFSDRGREKIIDYVNKKYGKENVCQIITFGTMAARAVVRDVGRVLGMPYTEVDRIAKMIPLEIGISLESALEKNPEMRDLYKADARVTKLIDLSMTLEGLSRHASTHAAGVVIAPSKLTDYIPLFKGSKGETTTQFDMKMTEEIGLLKMDFLGLRTLTVMQDCLQMIDENYGEKIDLDSIPLDDSQVYKLFARGDTVGVFQFESSGMQNYLRKLKPDNLNDLIAMNALYRPGPLDSGMIDTYIDRKQGREKLSYLHPILEKILDNTYGVIVYQEQVLQIANALAGYSLGKADILRKAMGKKIAEMMAAQKKEFLEGCETKKIDSKIAKEVFDQIETFARYGFNKSHSTGYAYVAYQCGWLKAHYPKEFMAANMTSEMDSSDRINILMEDCRRINITVLPPDINESEKGFSVKEEKIRFGLLAVKNVGEGPVASIIAARGEKGEFVSFADFVSRVSLKGLNRRTLESLIASGALDTLSGFRSQKTGIVENMLEFGHKVQESSANNDLFAADGMAVERKEPDMPDIPEWSLSQRLSSEKEILGFYVSGHPLDKYRMELTVFSGVDTSTIGDVRDGREISFGGIISVINLKTDKRGNRMAFITLEDFKGTVEAIIFSDCFEKCNSIIVADRPVMLIGRVSTREGEAPKIITDDIFSLDTLAQKYNCQLIIKLDEETPEKQLDQVASIVENFPGKSPIMLEARRNGDIYYIRSNKYRVAPGEELMNQLKEILGDFSVYLHPLKN